MTFEAVDRWSARAARGLCNLGVYGALPALLLLVSLDVVLRYVFNAPLHWSRDASGLLLLTTLFSALPQAWDQGYHIRMEVIYARMPERMRRAADVVSAAVAIAFLALLVFEAAMFSRYMFLTGETCEDLNAPLWPFMAFVAVCGVVFAARLLSRPCPPGAFRQGTPGEWI